MHVNAARAAAAARALACILLLPAVDHWSARLAQAMICRYGYDRPTGANLQSMVDRQGMPAMPHSPDLLVAEEEHIAPHVAAAITLAHPRAFDSRNAVHDLVSAVGWVASFSGPGAVPRIADARHRVRALFEEARVGLAEVEAALTRLRYDYCEPTTAASAPPADMALFACLIRARGWPDTGFTLRQVLGVPAVGDYPSSGLFREVDEPATVDPVPMRHSAQWEKVKARLEVRAANPLMREVLEEITKKTRQEVASVAEGGKQCAFGPFTPEELDAKFGADCWRCMHRFAIQQGVCEESGDPKYRCCDNAKSSWTNMMLSVLETISSEDASFPILAASLFYEQFGGEPQAGDQLRHSTDDIASAYRFLRCAHPEFSVVAIYDTVLERVALYTMFGMNFGLKAAVLGFNQHSQLLSMVAKSWFGVVNAAYFDDVDVCEPAYCVNTGKSVIHYLGRLMGTPFSVGPGSKDKPFAVSRAFLGVVSDLTNFRHGVVFMRPKPERVAKIVAALVEVLGRGIFPSGDCASIAGKIEYTVTSGGYGRVGRAALSAVRAWQHGGGRHKDTQIPYWLVDALSWLVAILPLLPPRRFRLARRTRSPPIVVYTDAAYDPGKPGMIGIVIYDPLDSEHKWRYASSSVPDWILKQLAIRVTYIGVYEVLAAVATYTSRTSQFAGRDVIHFVDNSGALFGLAKGVSGDFDSSQLISVFQTVAAAAEVNVWFEFVASGANFSDLPSRSSFAMVEAPPYSAARFAVGWPEIGAWHAGEFAALFADVAAKAGKKRKRGAAPL